MIALFVIFYVVVGAAGAAVGSGVINEVQAGRVPAPIGFVVVTTATIVEALAVFALAAWVLR